MARRGGKRLGAGRKVGSKARATVEQRGTLEELARTHTAEALQTLVSVATNSESDAARVSAATALLDRGYGKPRQAVEHSGPDGGAIQLMHEIKAEIAKKVSALLEYDPHGETDDEGP